MKTPKYTDDRYPHGYRRAAETEVRATFNRVRRELEAKAKAKKEAETAAKAAQEALDAANAAEVEVKVAKIKRTA